MRRFFFGSSLIAILAASVYCAGITRAPGEESTGVGIWGGCGQTQGGTTQACSQTATCSGYLNCNWSGGNSCLNCPYLYPNITIGGTANITVNSAQGCPQGVQYNLCQWNYVSSCSCAGAMTGGQNCGVYTENTASGQCST